jgi:hypothetical protein
MKDPKQKQAPPSLPPPPPLWRPTWKWHLKTLGVVYLVLVAFYFAVDRWLSRLPPPYRLREAPPEMTPWLK